MRCANEYIERTESAVRKFFEGIESYAAVLRRAKVPVLVSDRAPSDAELGDWHAANADALKAVRESQATFFEEVFSLATMCGAVLQVAAKALELFSVNDLIPPEWAVVVKSKYARYCVGRPIRRVPLGLVILAARNQHAHFLDDKPLREPNIAIFERLAIHHGRNNDPTVRDPAFDLSNRMLVSFAHNVTALLQWRSYEAYESDLKEMLQWASSDEALRV